MLTDGVAQRHRARVSARRTRCAGTVDLSHVGDRAQGASHRQRPTQPASRRSRARGFALATVGTARRALRNEGALVCAAVGAPRFDSRIAAEAANRHGAAADGSKPIASGARKCSPAAHGAWSVVLVDLAQRRALAAVDRFAIRPLCFTRGRQRALVREPRRRSARRHRRDRSAGDLRLPLSPLHPGAAHDLQGRSRLDAAHRVDRDPRSVSVERYWQPHFAPVAVPFADARGALSRPRSRRAVSDQLAGESIGCFLSGGTDSSTVAGMVTQVTGQPAKTYSIGFDAAGYDEMEYARIAARHFGTDHHEYYVTPDDLVERIPHVAVALRPAVRQLVGAARVLLRQARARSRRDADARRRRRRRALRRQLALCERQALHRVRARPRRSSSAR